MSPYIVLVPPPCHLAFDAPSIFHSSPGAAKVALSDLTGLMQEALRHAVSDEILMANEARKVGSEESLFFVGSSGWVLQHRLLANPSLNQGRDVSRALILYMVGDYDAKYVAVLRRSIADLSMCNIHHPRVS